MPESEWQALTSEQTEGPWKVKTDLALNNSQLYLAANKNLANRIGKGKINATGRKKSVQALLNPLGRDTKEKEESAVGNRYEAHKKRRAQDRFQNG